MNTTRITNKAFPAKNIVLTPKKDTGSSRKMAMIWKPTKRSKPRAVMVSEHLVSLYFFHLVLRTPIKKLIAANPTRKMAMGVISGFGLVSRFERVSSTEYDTMEPQIMSVMIGMKRNKITKPVRQFANFFLLPSDCIMTH